jgi:hypothetical protein
LLREYIGCQACFSQEFLASLSWGYFRLSNQPTAQDSALNVLRSVISAACSDMQDVIPSRHRPTRFPVDQQLSFRYLSVSSHFLFCSYQENLHTDFGAHMYLYHAKLAEQRECGKFGVAVPKKK